MLATRRPLLMGDVILTCIGARQHYEPARMLHKHGMLAKLITDFWAPPIPQYVRKLLPKSLSRVAGRSTTGIPGTFVRSFAQFGIRYRWLQRNAADRADLFLSLIHI